MVLGGIAMLVGALDPLEGAAIIFPGSGLVALGTFLSGGERRLVTYKTIAFVLVAFGVGAMWVLSSMGGFGGKSGLSGWWGLLILPYLVGWSMGIWGPGSPRWVLISGMGVGLWYLVLLGMIALHSGQHHRSGMDWVCVIVGTMGVVTIGGCISRLKQGVKLTITQ
jgi:hypothetical protein